MKKHHILILILSISSFSYAQDVEEVVKLKAEIETKILSEG